MLDSRDLLIYILDTNTFKEYAPKQQALWGGGLWPRRGRHGSGAARQAQGWAWVTWGWPLPHLACLSHVLHALPGALDTGAHGWASLWQARPEMVVGFRGIAEYSGGWAAPRLQGGSQRVGCPLPSLARVFDALLAPGGRRRTRHFSSHRRFDVRISGLPLTQPPHPRVGLCLSAPRAQQPVRLRPTPSTLCPLCSPLPVVRRQPPH